MIVNAKIVQQVIIDPKEVIADLLNSEMLGAKGFKEDDDKYYLVFTKGSGFCEYEENMPISKDKYDYIFALNVVLTNLK